MINHLTNVSAAFTKRQMVHTSHLFAKGANVKIVDCLPQFSLRDWHVFLSVLHSFFHASKNLKCSRTFGNHAIAAGFMIRAVASRASAIIRVKP